MTVLLCDAHRDERYLTRAGGTEFCDRLARIWTAAGTLTASRVKALQAHLRTVGLSAPERGRPGSYSWPRLRREAEARFAGGEAPNGVIAELRGRHRHDPADAPSVRTMRRWFAERRWLTTHDPPEHTPAPAAAKRRHRVRELIDSLPYMALLIESFPYIPNVATLPVSALTPRPRRRGS